MAKNEQTSKGVGSRAGKLLRNKKLPKGIKSPIASALTQMPDKKKPTKKAKKK